MKRFLKELLLRAIGDWFTLVSSEDGTKWGIYHPWRIHCWEINDTYEGAKKRADTYNNYLLKDNSLGR